jgi:hypothetical protein
MKNTPLIQEFSGLMLYKKSCCEKKVFISRDSNFSDIVPDSFQPLFSVPGGSLELQLRIKPSFIEDSASIQCITETDIPRLR